MKTLRINRTIIIVASIALVISVYFSNGVVIIFYPLVVLQLHFFECGSYRPAHEFGH